MRKSRSQRFSGFPGSLALSSPRRRGWGGAWLSVLCSWLLGLPWGVLTPVPWWMRKEPRRIRFSITAPGTSWAFVHSFNKYLPSVFQVADLDKCWGYNRRTNRHVHYPPVFYKMPLRILSVYSFINSSPSIYSQVIVGAPNLWFSESWRRKEFPLCFHTYTLQ